MRSGGTRPDRGGQLVLAIGLWLAAWPVAANAQFFGNSQDGSFTLRPPRDVPSVAPGPSQSIIPPSGNVAPKGPTLQSLPPANNPGVQAHAAPMAAALPAGQGSLAVSARFGRDLPQINGGLHWRVYRAEPNGTPRLVKEEKGPAPTFTLPHGAYVISVGFGLANVTKAVQVRAETAKDVFEIPAGGLRIEGRVGDARIPQGQISFDLYKGSQFEPGDKRPIATAIMTGDVVLLPEGTYHIVSNYGDANSTVRSDIRVEVGKLTDTTVNHRAAIITLKLVNDRGGEARANTQWSVLTPGGDVIKESIGAFPRVILAEGEYRVVARNDNKTYEGEFRVVNGVDREVEVIAR
ncbi:MAG TPA: hypothetical protein VFJ46_09990 [Xanthobacteraceae bacterium]|jgi:hypothetical protein|nr:hypothetical protein [Xanthobacteraceae bacterium]